MGNRYRLRTAICHASSISNNDPRMIMVSLQSSPSIAISLFSFVNMFVLDLEECKVISFSPIWRKMTLGCAPFVESIRLFLQMERAVPVDRIGMPGSLWNDVPSRFKMADTNQENRQIIVVFVNKRIEVQGFITGFYFLRFRSIPYYTPRVRCFLKGRYEVQMS